MSPLHIEESIKITLAKRERESERLAEDIWWSVFLRGVEWVARVESSSLSAGAEKRLKWRNISLIELSISASFAR